LIGARQATTLSVRGKADMKMRYLFLFLFSLVMIAPGLFNMPPMDRDESRFVQATKQMAETGNYIDIRFQDTPRYQKPIGIYWLQSAAVALSGEGAAAPIWVYRLVSLLAVAIAVTGIAWTGTRLFGPNAGIVAGLVLVAIFGVAMEGHVAKTDAALLACCVLAQGALAQIYMAARRDEQASAGLPWLFWIAQGVGILIKGPIAPLLSAITVVAVSLYDRDWRWLGRLKARWGLPLAVLIVLPWLILISWKSGGLFLEKSIGKDMLGKVAGGAESHGAPPGYYVLTYSLFMWPFGLIAVGAGLRALNRLREDARLRFCLAWYLPFWLLFELIPTKLPHYVLPAYPAAALLIGWLATLPAAEAAIPLRKWQSWLWWATAFGFGVVSLAIAVLAVAAPLYLMGSFSWWSIPAAIAALLAGYLAFSRRPQMSMRRIGAITVSAGITYAMLFAFIVPSLAPIWLSPRIVAAMRESDPCPTTVLASVGYEEPSLVFLAGTRTKFTDLDGAAKHLLSDPACAMAVIPLKDNGKLSSILGGEGEKADQLARIDGINYSSGNALSLGLYRIARQ
jgi:4-amino-4-deoxy-L-arabinose transferase-like glycosyltransferase